MQEIARYQSIVSRQDERFIKGTKILAEGAKGQFRATEATRSRRQIADKEVNGKNPVLWKTLGKDAGVHIQAIWLQKR